MNTTRRRHLRCPMANFLYAIVGADSVKAGIRDISAGGAALILDLPLAAGDRISLVIDGIGLIPAEVVRCLEEGVAVKFLIDEARSRDVESALLEINGATAFSSSDG